jgi:hypothetical protein
MDLSQVVHRRWARNGFFFGGFWRFPGTVDSHGFQRRNPEKSASENMGDSNHVFCSSIDSFFRETLKETMVFTIKIWEVSGKIWHSLNLSDPGTFDTCP